MIAFSFNHGLSANTKEHFDKIQPLKTGTLYLLRNRQKMVLIFFVVIAAR
jgi:hypothetical protein